MLKLRTYRLTHLLMLAGLGLPSGSAANAKDFMVLPEAILSSDWFESAPEDAPRAIIGEMSAFTLDRNSNRTSREIRSGAMRMDALRRSQIGDQRFIDVGVTLDLTVVFYGRQRCTSVVQFPEAFFTAAFMENLRQATTFVGPTFSVRHYGMRNVRNVDGRTYMGTDAVQFYNIRHNGCEISNLTMNAYLKDGFPVLGAVKVDIAGQISGRSVKGGADYAVPALD